MGCRAEKVLTFLTTFLKRKHVFWAQIGHFFIISGLKKKEGGVESALFRVLTKNNEKLWNHQKSNFSMLTCGLSPNFGEKKFIL
jgi:hypothetical protein